MDASEKAVQDAQDNIQSTKNRLEKSTATLESAHTELTNKISEQAAKQNELTQTEQKCKKTKETQDELLSMSEKLKRVVTFVAVTLGRTKVCVRCVCTVHGIRMVLPSLTTTTGLAVFPRRCCLFWVCGVCNMHADHNPESAASPESMLLDFRSISPANSVPLKLTKNETKR